jgi:hypothetical protein
MANWKLRARREARRLGAPLRWLVLPQDLERDSGLKLLPHDVVDRNDLGSWACHRRPPSISRVGFASTIVGINRTVQRQCKAHDRQPQAAVRLKSVAAWSAVRSHKDV